jgi:hypothetical protein
MRVSFKTVAAECKAKGYELRHAPGVSAYVICKGWNRTPFNSLFEALIYARELPALHTAN